MLCYTAASIHPSISISLFGCLSISRPSLSLSLSVSTRVATSSDCLFPASIHPCLPACLIRSIVSQSVSVSGFRVVRYSIADRSARHVCGCSSTKTLVHPTVSEGHERMAVR